MTEEVWVLGASMSKFGRHDDKDIWDLGAEAMLDALDDAQVRMRNIHVMACGCNNASVGQALMKNVGQTGIPVYNVRNACAAGATAIRTVVMAIKAGEADMGIAVGVEQMGKQGLLGVAPATANGETAFQRSGRDGAVMGTEGVLGSELMPAVFGEVGMAYARHHDGVGFEQFAKVAVKNHKHSVLNPRAQYQKEFTLEEVMNAPPIAYPNTLLMCCPNGDGAAALVLVSGKKLRKLDPDQRRRAVKITASVLASDPWAQDTAGTVDINAVTRNAADQAYETSGVSPGDLDLVELHDCFATAELVHYDNLRLCEPGGAGAFIDSGAPYRDGRIPVNVSGGLLSKGHPIGATGVAGVYEVTTHLRDEAGARQIPGAKVGMAHVIGLGSSCGIHILEKAATGVR